MDITHFQELGTRSTKASKFPTKVYQQKKLYPLFNELSRDNIQSNLEYFTSFHNRFYKSEYGKSSSRWLLRLINETIYETGAHTKGVSVAPFQHAWDQNSIIVTIPGITNSTIVVGAHLDSVNHTDPMGGRAPGADDDGSGTMPILEVLRVLLTAPDIPEGRAVNAIEFHWYSAEEAGMLGSQDI